MSLDFGLMGRNERMYHFMENWLDLSKEEIKELLPDIWIMGEWPGHTSDYEEWIEVFQLAGYVSDDGTPKPTEPLTIYRAATPFYIEGIAWTSEYETAKWFNDRNHSFGWTDSAIYQATVSPDHILGVFNERKEAEIVVDVNFITIKEVMEA